MLLWTNNLGPPTPPPYRLPLYFEGSIMARHIRFPLNRRASGLLQHINTADIEEHVHVELWTQLGSQSLIMCLGICNVLQCPTCSTWWNWRTRQTARTQRELKEISRRSGCLWEPGELQYQRNLERSNKAAFISLLERNGQKYDPNYQRGFS